MDSAGDTERLVFTIPEQVDPFLIGRGWVCTTHDGMIVHSRGTADSLPLEMRQFATELCVALNRQIPLDGRWIVGWTDFSPTDQMPKRLIMGYLDRDGDLLFMIDCEDPFLFMVGAEQDFVDQCHQAYQVVREHIRDAEVAPDQEIMAAKGQPSADSRAVGDWITDRI